MLKFVSIIVIKTDGLCDVGRNVPCQLMASSPCFCLSLATVVVKARLFLTKFLNRLVSHGTPRHGGCRVRGVVWQAVGRAYAVGGLVGLMLFLVMTCPLANTVLSTYSRRDSYSVAKHPVICTGVCAVGPRAGTMLGSALSSLDIATFKASSVVVGGRGGMRSVTLPLHCADSSAVLIFRCAQLLESAVIVLRAGAPCFRSVSYKCDVGRGVVDVRPVSCARAGGGGCRDVSSLCVGSGTTGVGKARGLGVFCHCGH